VINLFVDTEFTHIPEPNDPEPPSLISIGCVSEDGKKFYAENSAFQLELCSDFTKTIVLPLLEGGDVRMPYKMIANQFKQWIESFGNGVDKNVKMWTDAPDWDWQLQIKPLFDMYGWPSNLVRKPISLQFPSAIQNIRFQAAVKEMVTQMSGIRQHHALDDAIINRAAFLRATMRKY
jgi:hypothetical protein